MYNWDFNILWSYRWLLFEGTLVTIALTASIVVLGLLMGLIAGLAQISRFAFLRWVSWAYIELFRCTPLLVQLLWFYYALPILTGIEMSAITAAVLTLSLYGGSFYAEVIRGGIVAIDAGQREAGLALGIDASAGDASHYSAAGDQTNDPSTHESVDHPVQEYIAGFRSGCARSPLPRAISRDRNIPSARSLYGDCESSILSYSCH